MCQSDQQAHTPPMVWIVDDDDYVRDATQLLFQVTGWRVRTFATGESVLRCIQAEQYPDCLLLDIRLPDMSGIAVFEQLLQTQPSVPTILISGDVEIVEEPSVIIHKAIAVFRKPVAGDKLIGAIEAVLNRT